MNIPEVERSVTAKINRGAYSAWFLFFTLKAVGLNKLRLD
jgi:hypothetical protein